MLTQSQADLPLVRSYRMIYEEYTTEHGGVFIKKTDESGNELHIPKSEGNSDYQAYLRWLENPDADESGTL